MEMTYKTFYYYHYSYTGLSIKDLTHSHIIYRKFGVKSVVGGVHSCSLPVRASSSYRGNKHKDVVEHQIQPKDRNRIQNKNETHTTQTLIFTTLFCDDIHRIKCILMKHRKLIKQSPILNKIFPNPPILAYRNSSALRNRLVRAKLKPITPNLETCLLYTSDAADE